MPSPLREFAVTICGLIALITPLLLWTAWSTTMFWLVIALGCGAVLAIYALITWSGDEYF